MAYERIDTMILGAEEEVSADKQRAAVRVARTLRIHQTHTEAAGLASQLFDLYGAEPRLISRPHLQHGKFYAEYYRATPHIPLGELSRADEDGLTHGFAHVSAILGSVTTAREVRRFPVVGRKKLELVTVQPSGNIESVDVILYRGNVDGSTMLSVANLRTASSYGCPNDEAKAEQHLAALLNEREHAVEVLQALVTGATEPLLEYNS